MVTEKDVLQGLAAAFNRWIMNTEDATDPALRSSSAVSGNTRNDHDKNRRKEITS